jgi:hypothetical protein
MAEEVLSKILQWLKEGLAVLVFCQNGRHRSNHCCLILLALSGLPPASCLQHLQLRRNLVEFSHKQGPPADLM